VKHRYIIPAVLLPILSLLTMVCAQQQTPTLESILKKMDQAAASFNTIQADFVWNRYERVLDEVDDVQTGTIYFRRTGKEIEMKADVKTDGPSKSELQAEPKEVLFSNGKIQVFQPKPNIVNTYDAGNNRDAIETYLVLGFGGSGQDLQKSFDVKFTGTENVGDVATGKLELVPKSIKVKNTFSQIILWIDLDRGISVQQKFIEPQGDYKLAEYSGIRQHEKIPEDVFKLKTNGKTQFNSTKG
jgi:outer membrane lipoprotein-sorting protein